MFVAWICIVQRRNCSPHNTCCFGASAHLAQLCLPHWYSRTSSKHKSQITSRIHAHVSHSCLIYLYMLYSASRNLLICGSTSYVCMSYINLPSVYELCYNLYTHMWNVDPLKVTNACWPVWTDMITMQQPSVGLIRTQHVAITNQRSSWTVGHNSWQNPRKTAPLVLS